MPIVRAAALAAVPALLAGCAAVTAADGTRFELGSAEFRSYVERVFREQNKTGGDLAFALEDAGRAAPGLVAAEDTLLAACAGLNEVATSRRDEQGIGLKRSAQAARRAPDCERATLAAQAELAKAKD